MRNLKRDISLVVKENLTRLSAFALLITFSDENAEKLIHSFAAEVSNHYEDLATSNDLKLSLFRSLYRLALQSDKQSMNEQIKEPAEEVEEFFLYNRLEEDQIYDHEKILEFIADIKQIELEKLITEIPNNLRPYRFLKYVCEFSYQQIATILNVPIEYIEPHLAMVNKIIQVKLWENIVRNRDKLYTKTFGEEKLILV